LNLQSNVEEIEFDLLLEALHRGHGLDLREHARASLTRRLGAFAADEGLQNLSELQSRVLRDAACLERLSHRVSVSVTSMYRDPGFYRHLREEVVPQLRTWPSLLVWIAGCSTGEEVYSLNVLLHEEGLGGRVRIHATDRSRTLLAAARNATYPLAALKACEQDYLASGGRAKLSDSYKENADTGTMLESLRRNVTFSIHDLATDGRFNEFQLVMCRNVLIYFTEPLKLRVLRLIHSSLVPFGVLALGMKESIRHLPQVAEYGTVSEEWHTYRKVP